MRIVSGKYRGKVLKEFDLDSTRPTTDRVKESIFNLIQFDVLEADVLDLFAGTGALGVEAISRGANKVVFVDSNIKAINIIKENLKGVDGDYLVLNEDFKTFLKTNKTKFDIVLLDPPYKTNFGIEAIEMLIINNVLKEGAIIIFETSEENDFELSFQNFEIKKKKYGKIVVFKMVKCQ